MESTNTAVEIYQLRVWIRKISPQIWRRLLVRSDCTIAELHTILQEAIRGLFQSGEFKKKPSS